MAATDPRVRYLKTPQRVGLAGNWNFVAAHARGEFVTIIGDDDRLLPDFAGQMLSQATASVAVVFANHYVIDRARPACRGCVRHHAAVRRDRLAAGPLANPAAAVWRNSIAMSACAIRTSDVRRLQFKPDINTPELEFFARLARESPVFVFVPEYLAEYRSHAASATARGLTIDRLAEYLEPIEVPDDLEVVKRNLLQPMVTAGVGIRLERGDVAGARRLAMSRVRQCGFACLAAARLPCVPRSYLDTRVRGGCRGRSSPPSRRRDARGMIYGAINIPVLDRVPGTCATDTRHRLRRRRLRSCRQGPSTGHGGRGHVLGRRGGASARASRLRSHERPRVCETCRSRPVRLRRMQPRARAPS